MITPRDPGWKWYTHGVQLYTAMIESGTPFAQANYGDGEWACILGHEGQNVNGEVYEPALRDALRETLLDPTGQWCGWNPGKKIEGEAKAWIEKNGVDVPWVFKETLSAANVNGALGPFFRALRGRKVLVVGPPHLWEIDDRVLGRPVHPAADDAGTPGVFRFTETLESEAWKVWRVETEDIVSLGGEIDVVVCCAGMASNLIIHDMWREFRGELTLIDIGACLDPYCGVYSRKGYRKDSFQNESMEANLS